MPRSMLLVTMSTTIPLGRLVRQSRVPWTPLDRTAWIGRRVIVEGKRRTIVGVYVDIRGGVILDHPVGQFASWNVDDLKLAEE